MKNLLDNTIAKMRIALLLSLPAMFGIARCNAPFDHPAASADDEPVAVFTDADFTKWTVDEYGMGPLRAGLALPEASRLLAGAISVPEGEEAASCGYADWPAAPEGVFVMLERGVIARVEVDEASVPTAAGARVGDSEARIEQLYAGRVEREAHKFTDGRYLVVRAPAGDASSGGHGLIFETDGEKVIRYRAGRYPAVTYVGACGE